MNPMPPHNPLTIAKESMQMGKESGDRTFRLVALVMMAATGLGVLLQAGHMVWRDCFGSRRERECGRRDARPQPDLSERDAPATEDMPSRHEAPGTERRWTGKTEQARRTPEGGQQWTAYSDRQDRVRQR
jgi:hypothetical protein